MCKRSDEEKPKLHFVPYEQRSCTDVLMLLLFIAGWVAAFVILGEAVRQGGDPYRVLYGVQYDGKICGVSSGVENKEYARWFTPTDDGVDSFVYNIKLCVDECPPATTWKFYRYCVPVSSADFSGFEVSTESASRSIGDLYTTWPVILVSLFVAAILSLGYVYILRIKSCRVVIVWGSVLLVIVGGFLLGYGLIKYAEDARADPVNIDERALPAQILGWLVVGCTFIVTLLVFYLRNRIKLALEVTGTAAMALTQMKTLILFPVIPFLCIVAYAVYWVITALYLFSVKTYETKPMSANYIAAIENALNLNPGDLTDTDYRLYSWHEEFQKLFAYHFFHMLWVLQGFVYFTLMVIAGAMGNWYFSKADPNDPERRIEGDGEGNLSTTPVWGSVLRTLRFHLGSIFFGALIIAIIQFIRAIVTYIDQKTKDSQNRCARACLCITQCCLKCFETCINYISRNGLIWTAIKGDSFCVGCARSISLIISNPLMAAAMTFVGTFVVTLGQLAIALICAGASALIIESSYEGRVNSSVVPVVVIFILSYVIARIFLGVFTTSLDVMFICFLGDEGRVFVPPALGKAFDDAAAADAASKGKQTTQDIPLENQPTSAPTKYA